MGGGNDSYMSSNPEFEGDFIVRALHEYHTDSRGHLSFAQFQYIKVKHCEESGWWLGESENSCGWFPSNRVERVAAVYETEITSEDYDQIRTGLDGVETQFLGEPVSETLLDNTHDYPSALGRTRAGQLAFPPSQLSVPQVSYGPDSSSTDMENDMFYHHTISSTTSLNNSDTSYAYSDFVAEVTLYVNELRDATTNGLIDRYQPIVANIISCVKALLIFTNTIAKESEVLQNYPDLARSRRVILRALGKLYSKCRVANGSQALTTMKQRQFAVEKLSVFSGQVLGGITDFATRAREIGLRIKAENSPEPSNGSRELDMVLMASGEVERNNSLNYSSSHGRPRRRVSRANSAKGFKSFNAVRQWRTEQLQKHTAARKAIEYLLAEYMECLNGGNSLVGMEDVLKMTIQAGQAIQIFLVSNEEMKSRTNTKEDEDHATNRVLLSATLGELFGYIQILESAPSAKNQPTEIILNKFMSLSSIMLRCLVDLEIQPKTAQSSRDQEQSSRKGSISLDEEYETDSVSPAPPEASETVASIDVADKSLECESTAATSVEDYDVPSRVTTPRNTALARSKHTSSVGQVVPLNRKFISHNSLNDRNKRQTGSSQPPLGDNQCPNPEATYSEAHDLERNPPVDSYRSNHDSAVVITSAKTTPHHSLVNARKRSSPSISVVDEEPWGHKEPMARERSQDQRHEKEKPQGDMGGAIKDAERKITAIFMLPTTERSMLTEESVVTTSANEQHPLSRNAAYDQDTMAPPTPTLRPQFASESSKPASSISRSPRMRASDSNGRHSRTSGNRQGAVSRNGQTRPSADTERPMAEDSGIIGLGVSVPTGTRPRNSSSASNSGQGSASGSASIPRAPGMARARSPIPPSPRLESTRRMPRSDNSIHPHSPNLGPESRPTSRAGSNTTNLNPSSIPGSRRGSEHSIRSDMSGRRKSNDNHSLRENDARHHNSDRRPSSSLSGPRRNSRNLIPASPSIGRSEQSRARQDDRTSRPSTPTASHIQTFQDGPGLRRPSKNYHRESIYSNVSVATDSSRHSRSGQPTSPSLRARNHNQDVGGKGRHSSDNSSVTSERSLQQPHQQQQTQQTRGGPNLPSYRPRPNRVGQAKVRTSSELKQEAAGTAASTTTPWFLENDYEPDEVLYNDNGTLVAATLDAYIEMLTSHKNAPDAAFVMTFFTTFRLYVDPVELTNLLIKRFVMPHPELSDFDRLIWAQQKQERVQKRVHLAFKTWLESYWVTEKDRSAFRPIMEFVTHEMTEALPGPAGRLLDTLNQWVTKRQSLVLHIHSQTINKARSYDRINQIAQEHNSGGSESNSSNSKPFATVKDRSANALRNATSSRRGIVGFGSGDSSQSRGPPVPLVNKALLNALSNEQMLTKIPVTDIKAIELARQLTIMVGKLYYDIPYLELLVKEHPKCSAMVQVSNKITIWVTDTIVDEQDVKKRIGVVKHWIEVGEECLKLNNFDTLTAISSAIESTPVRRLYNTWEGINKAYFERAMQLNKVISSNHNYKDYKARLKTVTAPCIPFLGRYFTVISFIEDGNSIYKDPNPPPVPGTSSTSPTPTLASNRKLLRFGRFYQLAKAVQEFRDFQGVYELLEVPRLRDYILKCMENLDHDRNYRKSLAIEPRRPAPATPGGNGYGMAGGNGGHRSSSGGKGLFYNGISNSEMNGNSMPTKLNKLSFFRKSTRNDRS
ncbi:hypothetical protein BG011_004654 [Mortierella polycephala]|uniref:Ras GEF n=1 Tax=Mortierella polycephala TaxID=41804 RepID=A0A9P6PXQ8_9FUNG|nr:hypothetical protein BG011_004654 [Mortierella polycephala]